VATEVAALVEEGRARLARVSDEPQREAEILLAAALGRTRSWLLAHPDERILDCDATDHYEATVTRRARGEPVAYVLGEREFWSLPLTVTPDVLIPRPETELLVELALARLPAGTTARVLDLGSGSGAVALALAHERPTARVVGIDVAAAAVGVARGNATRLGIANAEFRVGDWFAPVAGERYAVIAGNPPYVAVDDPRVERGVRLHEPHGALFAGADGLDALRAIAAGAGAHLDAGGWLLVEHGDLQGAAVRGLLTAAGFTAVATHRDLAGLDRCTEGRWPGAPEA
jgi:release factor glutamine methyltransferase